MTELNNLVALATTSGHNVDAWAAAWRRSTPHTWPHIVDLVHTGHYTPREAAAILSQTTGGDR